MSQASGVDTEQWVLLSENGVLTHIPIIGNAKRLVTFLDAPYGPLTLNKRGQIGDHLSRMLMEFLSSYSSFLKPIEEFFSLTDIYF
ncbi:hypothetical protein CHARACLAT_031249 [Characodon lateralis]|uniref:Uncharacterized protein n=1 Tax=Characodon lateralis TaxID=208331 RepID=A0ABU7EYC5_9TELE|nr:hypothetical protein [Characodon lateralis]